MLYSVV